MKLNKGLLVLAAAFALGLAACNNSNASQSEFVPTSTSQSGETSQSDTSSQDTSSQDDSSQDASSEDSSSQDASSEDSSSEDSSSGEETPLDIAYAEKTLEQSDNAVAGQFTYWCGQGGSVSRHVYNSESGLYELDYDQTAADRFFSVQIYYLLPYAEGAEKYDITWTVYTDKAGDITLNGSVKTLAVGENTLVLENAELNEGKTLNVQLGVNITWPDVFTSLGGSTFKFNLPVVHDKNNLNYHEVKFVNNQEVLKDIQVKNGKTVVAPAAPEAPAGFTFTGWYDGEEQHTNATVISAPHTYVAQFSDSVTQYNVTIKDGATTLYETEVVAGNLVDLSGFVPPFGYEIIGYFTNSELTASFNVETDIIEANTELFIKKQIAVTEKSYQMYAAFYTHNDDGALTVSFEGWNSDIYAVQLNYLLPAGSNYKVDFTYSLNVTPVDVKIVNPDYSTAAQADLAIGNNLTGSLTFAGALSASWVSFELGGTTGQTTFVLHSITLSYTA